MPTAGKAAGAALLALLAFAVAAMIAPGLPTGVPHGHARVVAALMGAVTGWRITGRGARSLQGAAARGMTAALAAAFWTLLFGAAWLMLRRSLRGIYADPGEALGDMARLTAELATLLLDPAAAGLLVAGGALGGILTAAVARRLP